MRANQGTLGGNRISTSLHEDRLDAVMDHLLTADTREVADLGCGSGALLERLVCQPHLRRIVGVDQSALALRAARARLTTRAGSSDERISLRLGSVTEPDYDLRSVDAAALVEVLEHLPPSRLSRLEGGLFRGVRPRRVVITTPNREYNVLYGLDAGEYRHPDHRFEWDRSRFETWASGVAHRNGYHLTFEGVGRPHASFGSPTQMAVFRLVES